MAAARTVFVALAVLAIGLVAEAQPEIEKIARHRVSAEPRELRLTVMPSGARKLIDSARNTIVTVLRAGKEFALARGAKPRLT